MHSAAAPRLAFTPGEPAGIGPDLIVRLAERPLPARLFALADPDLLAARARQLGIALEIDTLAGPQNCPPHQPGRLAVLAEPLAEASNPGRLNPANARYVLNCIERATALCLERSCDALITGPVNKAVINDAGIAFSGHTGFIAERTGTRHPVMLLASDSLRVALATVHMPLRAVPAALTRDSLRATLEVLEHDLRTRFRCPRPRILVAGLNPHAGESGYLGREEIEVISPVLDALRATGMDLRGPLPADTLFTPAQLAGADAVLAMYHDQGLPVIKHAGFGHTVNVTLGLPIVRTSVDHGSALDLAGSAAVDTGSAAAAINMAIELTTNAP